MEKEQVVRSLPHQEVEHITIHMDLITNHQLRDDLIVVFKKHYIPERDGDVVMETITNIAICNNIKSGNCHIEYKQ